MVFTKTLVIFVYFLCKLMFCLFGVLWTIITILELWCLQKPLLFLCILDMLRSLN